MNDDQIRALWRSKGGEFHGPNIETGCMPEAQLLPFLRSLLQLPKRAILVEPTGIQFGMDIKDHPKRIVNQAKRLSGNLAEAAYADGEKLDFDAPLHAHFKEL